MRAIKFIEIAAVIGVFLGYGFAGAKGYSRASGWSA